MNLHSRLRNACFILINSSLLKVSVCLIWLSLYGVGGGGEITFTVFGNSALYFTKSSSESELWGLEVQRQVSGFLGKSKQRKRESEQGRSHGNEKKQNTLRKRIRSNLIYILMCFFFFLGEDEEENIVSFYVLMKYVC